MPKTKSSFCMPEFEECIAPPTSPRDIDYDNSELLALRIQKTREKLRKKYPTCNLPQITVTKQDENVLIKYDNIVNYCQSYSIDYYNQFARNEKEPTHRKVSPDVQPSCSWRRFMHETLEFISSKTPSPRGLLPFKRRTTRLLPLEAKHSSVNVNTNLQVPHKGGTNPMRRPLNNAGYKRGTDTEKVVHQREALPKIFSKNRNTQRKGTKKDGSKSILYEVKKKCRKSPKELFNEHQCNKTKNGRKGIYTRTRHDQPRLQN